MKRAAKVNMTRTAAAGLVLVAAAVMAAPGWGEEPEKKLEQRQEQKQEKKQALEKEQQLRRARRAAERGRGARAVGMIARELRLSRDQRNSLRELVRQRATDIRDAARGIGEARRALQERVVADTFDEAAIRGASEQLGAAITTASVLTARLASEIQPVLTPTQRDRLKRMSSRWEARRERWRKRIEHWDGD